MIKRKIKEIVKEYNEKGSLIKEVITETEEENDNTYTPSISLVSPSTPSNPIQPSCTGDPILNPYEITCKSVKDE